MIRRTISRDVEARLQPVDFTTALSELQGFLKKQVMVNVVGQSFGVVFNSRLDRVETLPTDDSSVMLHFENGEALDLDPELQAFIGSSREDQPRWLEFWIAGRTPAITIEALRFESG